MGRWLGRDLISCDLIRAVDRGVRGFKQKFWVANFWGVTLSRREDGDKRGTTTRGE